MIFRVAPAVVPLRSVAVVLALFAGIPTNPATGRGEDAVTQAGEGLRSLQADFKKAESDESRRAAADGLIALGAQGGRRLHTLARAEFLQRLPKHTAAFRRAAGEVLRRREVEGDQGAEIATLRKTILDVAALGDLTKEAIEQKSDPAIGRLGEMLAVTPSEVLAHDPDLAVERQRLLQLAEWAQRAAECMPEEDRRRLPAFSDTAKVKAELEAAEELAALLASPMISPADRQVLTANVALSRNIDPEEARGIQQLNQVRMLIGLNALVIDPGLVTACRVHSEDMCTKGFFAHESPVPGRETPWSRAKAAGTTASGENIAAGTKLGAAAIQMWWHSPGHHKNMLGSHKRTGLGRYEEHWTQLFG